MTRETKAGLVVSCSFLCLVGVVFYCKINGRNPSLGDEYSDIASVAAPSDPEPIEESTPNENSPSALAASTTSSGPALDSTSMAAPSPEGASNSSAAGHEGYRIPNPAKNGNEEQVLSASSASNNSGESENKNRTDPTGVNTTSAQGSANYAIPGSMDADKSSGSKTAVTDNKGRSTKNNTAGATIDPLADLKEAYKEAKNSPSSKTDSESTQTAEVNSEKSGKDDIKNSEADRNRSTNSEMANSSGIGANPNQVQTNEADKSSAAHLDPKILLGKESAPTPTGDQEPPPIPAGFHNPYQSLPEGPATAANSSDSSNRSSHDANPRKSSGNSSDPAIANVTIIGPNQGIRGASSTGGNSSLQGTVPTTTPNLTPTDVSNPSGTTTPNRSQTGSLNRDGKVAANSGQGSGLTPGVMPSPRITGLPPAGDTAPEPNVRLGPPTAGSSFGPSTPTSSHDSATALPPSNQFAQGPAPNFNDQSPPSANPNRNPAQGSGTIQPAGFPSAKVDSYDEETYLCKQGDKFEDISTKFYQTDKYAQALLLFNRNHPRAISAVRQDPPALGVGQPVFIPPLRVLQKQYATAIPDHPPMKQGETLIPTHSDSHNPIDGPSATGVAPGTTAGSQKSTPPDNRTTIPDRGTGTSLDGQVGGSYSLPGDNRNASGQYALPTDNRNPVPPSTQPGALQGTKPTIQGQDRIYQVPKNGETFWEIARKTLGNPNRWSEIRRLNPQLDPKYPVPGGTNLKMPADARIDPVAPAPGNPVN
jgi:hypothetical protein